MLRWPRIGTIVTVSLTGSTSGSGADLLGHYQFFLLYVSITSSSFYMTLLASLFFSAARLVFKLRVASIYSVSRFPCRL
jgi:hypothetical protein